MSDPFIQLGATDRREVLAAAASELQISAQILEKDVWICWALEQLFSMPEARPMAFKGGTSLSKIWKAITRFSEDIDITIDYRSFGTGFDHREGRLTRKRQDEITDTLRTGVKAYLADAVIPFLDSQLCNVLPADSYRLEHSDCGEKVTLSYPSVVVEEERNVYVQESVLLEFGGRNTLEPNDTHRVETFLEGASSIEGVSYPLATDVIAIDVARTFWEKVTLIHAVCGKNPVTAKAERLSRHWYDLHMLVAGGSIGLETVLEGDALLREVVALKDVFYYTGSAKYEDCLNGGLRLTPDTELLGRVRYDYSEMRGMNLVQGDPPSFDEILATIGVVESAVNAQFEDGRST